MYAKLAVYGVLAIILAAALWGAWDYDSRRFWCADSRRYPE